MTTQKSAESTKSPNDPSNELFECTIIVPCRNEAAAIGPFLESLTAQEKGQTQWEIIIADGDSDDGTADILAQYARQNPEVRVVSNPEGIVSTGLNRAITSARGKYIVRMDVHTVYAEDYVRQCLAVIRKTGAMNVGGAARTKAEGWLPRTIAAAYGSPFAVGGARFHFASYEGPVDTVTYGCWLREDLVKLGMFDVELVRNQDDELNLRILRAGGVIWQDPCIRSWYSPRGSLRQLFKQYFQYGFWKVAVIRKHRIPASWRHLVPVTLVVSLMLLLIASAFLTPARLLLYVEMGCYLTFIGLGSIRIASRSGWSLLPLLPVVIGCFHFSYGSGFLMGLLSARSGKRPQNVKNLSR